MSVQEKMTAIADAIRDKTGSAGLLTLDDMVASVPEVYEAGRTAEKEVCDAQYFKTSFVGDGTKTLTVKIPFMPDSFSCVATSPLVMKKANSYNHIYADPISAARYSAVVGQVTSAGQTGFSPVSTGSLQSSISYNDGALTFCINAISIVFQQDCRYFFYAVKYPGETTKSVTERDIALLPDTPTGSYALEFNKSRIEATFSNEEWAALIATKPNWTFSLV